MTNDDVTVQQHWVITRNRVTGADAIAQLNLTVRCQNQWQIEIDQRIRYDLGPSDVDRMLKFQTREQAEKYLIMIKLSDRFNNHRGTDSRDEPD